LNALRKSVYILAITIVCLIVLGFVVHVVAVGGIYAFNSWQSHKANKITDPKKLQPGQPLKSPQRKS
jgi:hypothetical protein